ncbi:MAG: nucleotidyltransferase family protein [Deltaproteobacteria bacterium]|nr:nucleotidyltransferase family protein [Deltaproteobacteria bacterium]
MPVTAVLLAAGGSRRLGEPKQLLRLAGQTLIRRAALAALGSRVGRVLVVTGARAAEVEAALTGLAVECVGCERWEAGLAASLRTGVEAALARGDESVLVMLADQPAVDAALLDALIAQHAAGAEIAACEYGGEPGVPALFSPPYARKLLALEGDRGAKALLVRERAHRALVPFPDGALDVDTRDDWERARRILEARAADRA